MVNHEGHREHEGRKQRRDDLSFLRVLRTLCGEESLFLYLDRILPIFFRRNLVDPVNPV